MALAELVFFKRPEEEEEEDTKARNNLTPLLGLVGPIFKPDPNACPIFQIYKINRKDHQIRVILSDGYDLEHAVVEPELYEEVQSNPIPRGSIVEIQRHSMHSHIAKKYRLIRIHAWEVLVRGFRIIGWNSLEYGIWPFGGEWSESDWEEANYRGLDFDDRYREGYIEENLAIHGTGIGLTADALVAINLLSSAFFQPTLQIVDIRNVSVVGIPREKFRMILSDGEHVQQSFLGTDELIQKAKANLFVKGSAVKLLHFEWRTISFRRILFVLNMHPVTIEGIPDPRPAILAPDVTMENIGPLTQDEQVHQD